MTNMTGTQRTHMLAEIRATQEDMRVYDPNNTQGQADLTAMAETLIAGQDLTEAQMSMLAEICAADGGAAERTFRVIMAGGRN